MTVEQTSGAESGDIGYVDRDTYDSGKTGMLTPWDLAEATEYVVRLCNFAEDTTDVTYAADVTMRLVLVRPAREDEDLGLGYSVAFFTDPDASRPGEELEEDVEDFLMSQQGVLLRPDPEDDTAYVEVGYASSANPWDDELAMWAAA